MHRNDILTLEEEMKIISKCYELAKNDNIDLGYYGEETLLKIRHADMDDLDSLICRCHIFRFFGLEDFLTFEKAKNKAEREAILNRVWYRATDGKCDDWDNWIIAEWSHDEKFKEPEV